MYERYHLLVYMEEMNGSKPGKITVFSSASGTKVRFLPLLYILKNNGLRTGDHGAI
jgi:hypothetical protein